MLANILSDFAQGIILSNACLPLQHVAIVASSTSLRRVDPGEYIGPGANPMKGGR